MKRQLAIAMAAAIAGISSPGHATELTITLPNGTTCTVPMSRDFPVVQTALNSDLQVRTTAETVCGSGAGAGSVTSGTDVILTLLNGQQCSIPINQTFSIKLKPDGGLAFRSTTSTICGNSGGAGSPVFTAPLTAAPLAVATGGTVSLSYTTTGALTCTGSVTRDGATITLSGWTGSRPTSSTGSTPITLATAGNYVFTIACANASGTTSSSAPPVPVGSGSAAGCANVQPVFGLIRQTTMRNRLLLQGNTFWPQDFIIPLTSFDYFYGPWPARYGNRTITIKRNHYVALEFTTGPSTATYFQNQNWVPPAEYGGQPVVTVSECAGEFNNLPPTIPAGPNSFCRQLSGGYGGFVSAVNYTGTDACLLRPNTRYYLNLTFKDINTGANNRCPTEEPANFPNPTSCHFFSEHR